VKRLLLLVPLLALLQFGGTPARAEPFVLQIDMYGDQVVPPVDTHAWGFVRFFFNDDRTEANYTVDIKGYSGSAVTGAEIRRGAPGESGPVLFKLSGADFIVASGHLRLTPEQLQGFVSGNWYVTLSTSFHPDGEVRGQIVVPESFLTGAPAPRPEPPAPSQPPPAVLPTAPEPGTPGPISPPNTGDGGLR
jgi:hypothetical protein